MAFARGDNLRVRHGHDHHRVTFVELFFDLVFVFAVTQLSHGLLHHLTPLGAIETGLLMVAVWWAWIDTAWTTNWLDPDRPLVRIILFLLMLGGLVLASAIPQAFESRAIVFAVAYIAMQALRDLFMLWVLRGNSPGNFRNFLRIGAWHLCLAPLWIAGALLGHEAQLPLWAVAVVIESVGPVAYFWVPGLGRSTTSDWTVEGGHMAERCALFVIIALGESILITGATFAEQSWAPLALEAFAAAFVGSIAMWGVYFNIGAERGSRQIAASDDPGRLARSGYTYLHMPIIAGIIVCAVGDDLVLHDPLAIAKPSTTAVLLGGPALYLAGNALFKRLSAPNIPFSHMVGFVLLAVLVPFASSMTTLALAAAATAVLIVVVVWEWRSLGSGRT
jgi:low temperature requirement protein LtrA